MSERSKDDVDAVMVARRIADEIMRGKRSLSPGGRIALAEGFRLRDKQAADLYAERLTSVEREAIAHALVIVTAADCGDVADEPKRQRALIERLDNLSRNLYAVGCAQMFFELGEMHGRAPRNRTWRPNVEGRAAPGMGGGE